MGARNPQGFLSAHALRSGLREQVTSGSVFVELAWTNKTDNTYVVTLTDVNERITTTVYRSTSLGDTRHAFRRAVRANRRNQGAAQS